MFQRGIYFTTDLELERALALLELHGFEVSKNMTVRSEVEVAVSFENKRLLQKNTSFFQPQLILK